MRKHRSDRIIGVLTFVLMAVGLIIIYAIGPMRANSMNNAYGSDYSENYFFVHQAISVAISVIAFILAFKLPYEKVRKYAKVIVVLGLALCVVLAILAVVGSSMANCQLGACRWINLGGLSVQPAEILKLGLVLYLAQMMAQKKKEGTLGDLKEFFVPFAIVVGLSLFFVVIVQKDLGTGVTMVMMTLLMLYMSGIEMKKFWAVVGIVAAAGVLAIVTSPHRMERLLTFGGNSDDNASYHIDNALMAIGSGGLFGKGIGNSVQATGYLPESINDSIFAVLGETFGFFGLMLILVAFVWLLTRLLKVSAGLEMEQSLVVVGIFAWIGTHVIVNIAAMTGLVPLTGITLPLLSYGGTSMMMMAFGLGLVLQLSCYTNRKEERNEDTGSRGRVGRTRHASRRGRD